MPTANGTLLPLRWNTSLFTWQTTAFPIWHWCCPPLSHVIVTNWSLVVLNILLFVLCLACYSPSASLASAPTCFLTKILLQSAQSWCLKRKFFLMFWHPCAWHFHSFSIRSIFHLMWPLSSSRTRLCLSSLFSSTFYVALFSTLVNKKEKMNSQKKKRGVTGIKEEGQWTMKDRGFLKIQKNKEPGEDQ